MSKIIAKGLPTLSDVALAKDLPPVTSKRKLTTGVFVIWSNPACASANLSPDISIFLLTNHGIASLSYSISERGGILPRKASDIDIEVSTILKLSFAVLPSKSFNLAGSSRPGTSNRILLLPCLCIEGSVTPRPSILLLTISIDWLTADLYLVLRASLVNEISNVLPELSIFSSETFWVKKLLVLTWFIEFIRFLAVLICSSSIILTFTPLFVIFKLVYLILFFLKTERISSNRISDFSFFIVSISTSSKR